MDAEFHSFILVFGFVNLDCSHAENKVFKALDQELFYYEALLLTEFLRFRQNTGTLFHHLEWRWPQLKKQARYCFRCLDSWVNRLLGHFCNQPGMVTLRKHGIISSRQLIRPTRYFETPIQTDGTENSQGFYCGVCFLCWPINFCLSHRALLRCISCDQDRSRSANDRYLDSANPGCVCILLLTRPTNAQNERPVPGSRPHFLDPADRNRYSVLPPLIRHHPRVLLQRAHDQRRLYTWNRILLLPIARSLNLRAIERPTRLLPLLQSALVFKIQCLRGWASSHRRKGLTWLLWEFWQ